MCQAIFGLRIPSFGSLLRELKVGTCTRGAHRRFSLCVSASTPTPIPLHSCFSVLRCRPLPFWPFVMLRCVLQPGLTVPGLFFIGLVMLVIGLGVGFDLFVFSLPKTIERRWLLAHTSRSVVGPDLGSSSAPIAHRGVHAVHRVAFPCRSPHPLPRLPTRNP